MSADNAFEPIRLLFAQLPEVVRHPTGGNTPALSPDNAQGGHLATLSEGSLAKDGSDETARQWQRDPNSRALLRPRDGAVAFVHASRTIQVETSDKRGRSIGTFSQCSVAALSDLGLTDAEISQYFGVEVHRVRRLLDGHDGPMENRSLREFALRVRARLLGKAK